jgi:hypothetical protein
MRKWRKHREVLPFLFAKAGRGRWVSLRQNCVLYQKMEQSGGEWQKLGKML